VCDAFFVEHRIDGTELLVGIGIGEVIVKGVSYNGVI